MALLMAFNGEISRQVGTGRGYGGGAFKEVRSQGRTLKEGTIHPSSHPKITKKQILFAQFKEKQYLCTAVDTWGVHIYLVAL